MRKTVAGLAVLVLAAGAALAAGPLIAEGGGATNKEALARFAGAVHGAKTVCFITTADPGDTSGGSWLKPVGLNPEAVLVTADNAESREIADKLAHCDGFYFGGGAPKLLSDAFFKNGRDTLALATIRRRNQDGAPIAGGSAGAMILGPSTMCACGMPVGIRALTGERIDISKAFSFLPVPLDVHAMSQNLYSRELFVMGQEHWQRLLVLDESAAVEIPGDGGPWIVLGDRAVALLQAPRDAASLAGFDISFLHKGDTIDPLRFEPITTGRKALPPPHAGWMSEDLQAPPGELLNMANAIAGGSSDAYGWDVFWYPDKPVRLHLKWTDQSAAFEGATPDKWTVLLTHLSLTLERPSRDAYKVAVTVPFDRRLADRDWRIAPLDGLRTAGSMDQPTPTTAPGVTVYDHDRLKAALADGRTLVFNALPDTPNHRMQVIANSQWLSGAGTPGQKDDATDRQLGERLKVLTGGDRTRPVVFYCVHAACWWSYNAAQRARGLGYKNVGWYRGGLLDWSNYGDATITTDQNAW